MSNMQDKNAICIILLISNINCTLQYYILDDYKIKNDFGLLYYFVRKPQL